MCTSCIHEGVVIAGENCGCTGRTSADGHFAGAVLHALLGTIETYFAVVPDQWADWRMGGATHIDHFHLQIVPESLRNSIIFTPLSEMCV